MVKKYKIFYTVSFSIEVVVKLPITGGLYIFEFSCLSMEFSVLCLAASIWNSSYGVKTMFNFIQKRIYDVCLYSFIQEVFIKYLHFIRVQN